MSSFYDLPGARSRAATLGWQTRRAGTRPWSSFHALAPRVEDGPARLLCCELAERTALPVYRAAFPDDPRPALILWTARRYARGEAAERERLGMRQVAIAMTEALDPGCSFPRTPAGIALQPIAWCLDRPTNVLLDCVWNWLRPLQDAAAQEALLGELVAALEAMPRRPGKEVPAHQQAR